MAIARFVRLSFQTTQMIILFQSKHLHDLKKWCHQGYRERGLQVPKKQTCNDQHNTHPNINNNKHLPIDIKKTLRGKLFEERGRVLEQEDMEAENHLATKHHQSHNQYQPQQQQQQPQQQQQHFYHIMSNTSETSFNNYNNITNLTNSNLTDHHSYVTTASQSSSVLSLDLIHSSNSSGTQACDATNNNNNHNNNDNDNHNMSIYKSRELSPISFLDSPVSCEMTSSNYHLNLLTSDSTDIGKSVVSEPSDENKKTEVIRLHDEIQDLNMLRQGIVALNGIKTMDDSWHEHTHWKFVCSDEEGNCVECENEFQKGDLISVGKRIVDIGNNVQQSVQGHDKLHWNCSKFWSRRKDEPNAASSFGELVTKIIGGVDSLKQIEDWDLLDVDSKIKVFKHAKLEIDQQLVAAQREVQKKRKRELLEECRIEDLDTKSFRDLQSLAKRLRIKANQKKDDLISSLRAALTSEDD